MRDRLAELLGKETAIEDVAHTLRHLTQELNPATVGAMLLTCSDESEGECIEAFQRHFVWHLLPALKFGKRTAFRGATLGGRYEWGAARLAEQHFATRESADSFKLMVVKINSHVSRDEKMKYGEMERYHVPSHYCGALRQLLDGRHGPAVDDLRHTFSSEGLDRLALLREHVPEALHPVAAALVNARLQARKAVLDIQDFEPHTPTFYLIMAAVTVNHPGFDSELICGTYLIDRRGEPTDEYRGLGDDPSKYAFEHVHGRLVVRDDHIDRPREVRNHRDLIREAWQDKKPGALSAVRDVRAKRKKGHLAKPLLKTLILSLSEVAVVPAALFLFAEGLVGIHHAWRAHRLAKKADAHEDAKLLLREFEEKLEHLPPDRAHEVLDALVAEFPGS